MKRPSSSNSSKITKEVFKSPVKLVISLILIILIIDIGITVLIKILPINNDKISGLFDSFLLIILIGPALYFLVFRPMLHYVAKSTRIQLQEQVLYEITEGMTTTSNLAELLKLIHTSIGKVLYAENFYFALYDHEKGIFSFPYFVDKYDDPPEGSSPLEKSCTAYIFHKGKSMLIPTKVFQQLVDEGEVELVGSFSPSWVGIPLRVSPKTIGVMVLQHYENENMYDEGHLKFLDSIASQVANVIERKRAEDELEQSVSLLTATLESTEDGILVLDKSGEIVNYNCKFAELWRISESVLEMHDGKKLMSIIKDQLKEPDGIVKANKEIFSNEDRISYDSMELKDGRIFERYSQPQRAEGKVIGRVWSYRNITERRKAERELQESEEKFRTFFEKSPVGIDIYDAKGDLIDINKTSLEMFGIVNKEDVIGLNLNDGTSLNNELLDQLQQGSQIDYNAYFDFDEIRRQDQFNTTKRGKTDLHYSVTPLKSAKDEKIIGYLAIIQDITERLKAERELKEEENRYRTLFESANDAIFTMSKDTFLNCNQMTLQIFECEKKEDIIGHTPWEFSPEYQPGGESSKKLAKEMIDAAFEGEPQRFYWKHMAKDGTLFDADVVLNRFEVDGTFFLQVVVRDITESKKSEDLLKENEIRLRELNASKDKFFSIIAHDLKGPFNAILGFSDLLVEKTREKDYDGIDELADLLQKSSERTFNLLLNLLEWARSQIGKVKFEPEIINISKMVKRATETLKDVAIHKSILITKEIPEGDKVYADEAMFETVLRNLVSNAIKFTGVGGKIVISAEQNKKQILFKVNDNGTGMEKSDLEKLFRIDDGYSRPGTLNEKGTGLGLLICKEFVEKHGGNIWAESKPGKGSIFCFTLPSKK